MSLPLVTVSIQSNLSRCKNQWRVWRGTQTGSAVSVNPAWLSVVGNLKTTFNKFCFDFEHKKGLATTTVMLRIFLNSMLTISSDE